MNDRKRTLRIVEPKPAPPTFARRIEAKARRLAQQSTDRRNSDATLATLVREMSLALGQLEGIRKVHGKVRRNLLRQECYLETEITQREPRPPVYEDHRLPERDRLRDRLRTIEKERRKLLLSEEEQLRPLHDRLLTLLNRHDQLQF